jgi:hypothetical protein
MSALARTQREFMSAIASGAALPPGMEVYRRGLQENRAGALSAAYPVVGRLVGEAFFREAAARYGDAFPSRSGDLHQYGGHFAQFLAGYPHAAQLEYLPDVARLEWAVHESHHAPDGPAFDFTALAAIEPAAYASLTLAFSPAFRRVASAHPIHALWLANQPHNDGTPAAAGPQRVVVTRARNEVRLRLADADEWELLERLACGETLGAAIEALGERAARLPEWLARYGAEEALSGFGRIASA